MKIDRMKDGSKAGGPVGGRSLVCRSVAGDGKTDSVKRDFSPHLLTDQTVGANWLRFAISCREGGRPAAGRGHPDPGTHHAPPPGILSLPPANLAPSRIPR